MARESSERWLCSHLVELVADGGDRQPETVVLEEIAEEEAVAAVEQPLRQGSGVMIRATGLAAHAMVTQCLRRENDFQLEMRFDGGFRWSPEVWRPDHLYRPRPQARQAKGAASTD